MARQFNGSNQALQASIDLSATNKITIVFWLWWDAFADDDDIALEFTANAPATNGGFIIDPNSSFIGAGTFRVGHRGDVGQVDATFTRPSAVNWHHYAVLLDMSKSSNEVDAVYVNGVSQSLSFLNNSNNTGNFADDTLNFMSRALTSNYGAGRLAEVAIWSELLTIDEIKALAAGVKPVLVHTNVKPYYWPLIGSASPETELFFGANATVTGATQVAHPPATNEYGLTADYRLSEFTPAAVITKRAWLKADAIVGLNDGNSVATWSDSSGQGFDATMATGSRQPIYKTNIINGKPTLRWNAANNTGMNIANTVLAAGDSFSIFIVCRLNSFTTYRTICQKGNTNNQKIYILANTGNGVLMRWSALTSTYTFVSDTWALIEYVHSATSDTNATETFYVNGVEKGTRTGVVPASQTGSVLNIGHAADQIPWDEDIAEFFLCREAVSTEIRQALEAYFSNKYAIW